jgi:hypothetical protein
MPTPAINDDAPVALTQEPVTAQTDDGEIPADFLIDENPFFYRDYKIERRTRKGRLEMPEAGLAEKWVDVDYVTVTRKGRLLASFDANVYFGLGNSAGFALIPLLGGDSPELFVSQDVVRAGCQWIASLSPQFRVIFDGQEFSVGREGSDLIAIDLDNDDVYEIEAPVTDFYAFHDKMSMSQIPLPTIIFKYDAAKGKYLPANSRFEDYLLEGIQKFESVNDSDQFKHRAVVLDRVLTYVYLGKRKEAWEFFDRSYELHDIEEMKRRIKSILFRDPVYNFIYKRGTNK